MVEVIAYPDDYKVWCYALQNSSVYGDTEMAMLQETIQLQSSVEPKGDKNAAPDPQLIPANGVSGSVKVGYLNLKNGFNFIYRMETAVSKNSHGNEASLW